MILQPGKYLARLRLRSATPQKSIFGSWGRFELLPFGENNILAATEIDPIHGKKGDFREQVLPFDLPETTRVETRITGGDAGLWLDSVYFEQVAP